MSQNPVNSTQGFVANCPISTVRTFPESELIPFNGFAWSNVQGMIHQSNLVSADNPLNFLGD